MKDRQTFVGCIPQTHPVPNPVIRSPKRQHVPILIEAIILLSEAINDLGWVKMILEIYREYLAVRTKPECQVIGAGLRHFISSGVIK